MGSPEDLKMDVAGVCKWCGVKLTESPLLSCEEMKVVKWQQLIRDDLYGSTSKSVIVSYEHLPYVCSMIFVIVRRTLTGACVYSIV